MSNNTYNSYILRKKEENSVKIRKIKKGVLKAVLTCLFVLTIFGSTKVYAAMADEAEGYVLGETYTGYVQGGGNEKYYKFKIDETSHVTFYLTKHFVNYGDSPSVDVYNSSGKCILPDEDMQWKHNTAKGLYDGQQYRVLKRGTYYIRFYYTGDFSLKIQAEKQIELPKGKISSLQSKNKGQITVKCKAAQDAIGYRIIIATDEKFTKNKKVIYSPTATKTIKNLKKGTRYYVKVCPYTIYDDGTKVFGQNSLAKTVVVKKK